MYFLLLIWEVKRDRKWDGEKRESALHSFIHTPNTHNGLIWTQMKLQSKHEARSQEFSLSLPNSKRALQNCIITCFLLGPERNWSREQNLDSTSGTQIQASGKPNNHAQISENQKHYFYYYISLYIFFNCYHLAFFLVSRKFLQASKFFFFIL